MTEVIVEPLDEYDILLNEDDEVLIAIRARLGGVSKPQILYDGQDKVLLYRTSLNKLLSRCARACSQRLAKSFKTADD